MNSWCVGGHSVFMDGSNSPQGSRFGAWVEGMCLISTLGLLLSVLLLTTRPSSRAAPLSGTTTPALPEVADDRVVELLDTHLVVLVDQAAVPPAALSRRVEAGMDHVSTVEVIAATDTVILGLREALDVADIAPCHAHCQRLAILDIRTEPAP